jgi:integrase/recombinase XerD
MIKIVEEFKTHIMEDGKSTNTIQSYVRDVTAFIKYIGTMNVKFDGVLKRFYITSYKNYLVDNSYGHATINNF